MPSAPLPPEQQAEIEDRTRAIREAVDDEIGQLAELLDERAGTRVSESTVERTTEDAGQRRADLVQAGASRGPKRDWPWHKDYEGKQGADGAIDATGVRPQGEDGGPAEGRMASVGMVCTPCPEWPWLDERPRPMPARYLSGCTRWTSSAPCSACPPGTSAGTGPTAGSGCPTAASAWRIGSGRT